MQRPQIIRAELIQSLINNLKELAKVNEASLTLILNTGNEQQLTGLNQVLQVLANSVPKGRVEKKTKRKLNTEEEIDKRMKAL